MDTAWGLATYASQALITPGTNWGNITGSFICTTVSGTSGKLLAVDQLAVAIPVTDGESITVLPKMLLVKGELWLLVFITPCAIRLSLLSPLCTFLSHGTRDIGAVMTVYGYIIPRILTYGDFGRITTVKIPFGPDDPEHNMYNHREIYAQKGPKLCARLVSLPPGPTCDPPFKVYGAQFFSDPLRAQTINGNVLGQMLCTECFEDEKAGGLFAVRQVIAAGA